MRTKQDDNARWSLFFDGEVGMVLVSLSTSGLVHGVHALRD